MTSVMFVGDHGLVSWGEEPSPISRIVFACVYLWSQQVVCDDWSGVGREDGHPSCYCYPQSFPPG